MDAMNPETIAVIAIIIAAGSEVIALTPLKSNSWIQLLLTAARMAFPKKPAGR
jgi:hypothetical protein